MAEPLPEMEPRTVAGQRVRPVPKADGTIPRSRRQAFGSAFSFMNDLVLDRWEMLGEQPETVTEDEFLSMKPEGAPIEFFQGMTRRQAETRIAEFEHSKFESQFEQFPLTQFGGMAVPFFWDAGTILTLPFGAKNIARASAANSLRQFTLQSAIGAGKVSLGTTLAEGGLQLKQTGGIDPLVLGASAAVPFAAVPTFGALGRGARALAGVRDGEFTNQVGKLTGGKLSPDEASNVAQQSAAKRPPPARVSETEPFRPQRRLAQAFEDYPGGRMQWARDLSAGRGSAREFARGMNVDPDAPAIRDLIIGMQDRSARTSRTPMARNVADRTDINTIRQGGRPPEANLERLREDGLVLPARGDGDVELSETGGMLAKALAAPENNRKLLNDFQADGPGALDRAATRRGIDLDPASNPKASPNRVAAAEISDDEIIKALESARLETADTRPGAPSSDIGGRPARQSTEPANGGEPRPQARPERAVDTDRAGPEVSRPPEPDPEDAAQASKIRKLGGDPEESETIGTRFFEAVTRCGESR